MVSEPLFVVGIVTFVICLTLPFVLIRRLRLLVMKVFVLLASNIVCCCLIHVSAMTIVELCCVSGNKTKDWALVHEREL